MPTSRASLALPRFLGCKPLDHWISFVYWYVFLVFLLCRNPVCCAGSGRDDIWWWWSADPMMTGKMIVEDDGIFLDFWWGYHQGKVMVEHSGQRTCSCFCDWDTMTWRRWLYHISIYIVYLLWLYTLNLSGCFVNCRPACLSMIATQGAIGTLYDEQRNWLNTWAQFLIGTLSWLYNLLERNDSSNWTLMRLTRQRQSGVEKGHAQRPVSKEKFFCIHRICIEISLRTLV